MAMPSDGFADLMSLDDIDNSFTGLDDVNNSFTGPDNVENSFTGTDDVNNSFTGPDIVENSFTGTNDVHNSFTRSDDVDSLMADANVDNFVADPDVWHDSSFGALLGWPSQIQQHSEVDVDSPSKIPRNETSRLNAFSHLSQLEEQLHASSRILEETSESEEENVDTDLAQDHELDLSDLIGAHFVIPTPPINIQFPGWPGLLISGPVDLPIAPLRNKNRNQSSNTNSAGAASTLLMPPSQPNVEQFSNSSPTNDVSQSSVADIAMNTSNAAEQTGTQVAASSSSTPEKRARKTRQCFQPLPESPLWCRNCFRVYFTVIKSVDEYHTSVDNVKTCNLCANMQGKHLLSSFCNTPRLEQEDPEEIRVLYAKLTLHMFTCISKLHPNYAAGISWDDRCAALSELFPKKVLTSTSCHSRYYALSGKGGNKIESPMHKAVREVDQIWNSPLQKVMEFITSEVTQENRVWTEEEDDFLVERADNWTNRPRALLDEFNMKFGLTGTKGRTVVALAMDARIWALREQGRLPVD